MGTVKHSSRALISICCLIFLQTASAQKLDPLATQKYAIAVGLHRGRLYDRAIEKWKEFLNKHSKDPRVPKALHYLGACQMESGKLTEAIATFRRALKDHPKAELRSATEHNLALTLYKAAKKSKKAQDFKTAAQAFAKVRTADARYSQGECLFDAGDKAGALAAYQSLIKDFPKSDSLPDAYYSVGVLQEELKQYPQALSTFQAFVRKFPKNAYVPECQLRTGQLLLRSKKYPQAAQIFRKVANLRGYQKADRALLMHAHTFEVQKQYPRAGQLYETLRHRFPKSGYLGYSELKAGKCWYHARQHGRAVSAFRRVVALKAPQADEASYWIGFTLLEQNKVQQAVNELQRSITAYPKSSHLPRLVFLRLTGLNRIPKQQKGTIPLLIAFAKKYPKHEHAPRALYLASLTAYNFDDFTTARAQAERFLSRADTKKHELRPSVLLLAGESYRNGTKPDMGKAEAHLQALVKGYPKYENRPRALTRLAECLYLRKEIAQANQILTPILPKLKSPTLKAEAYQLQGRLAMALKNPNGSIVAYQKSIAASPKWQRADETLILLALAYQFQNKTAEQEKTLKRLVTQFPKSDYIPEAHFRLGDLAQSKKNWEVARKEFQSIVTKFPNSSLAPQSLFRVASIQFENGENDKAVTEATTLLTKYPKSDVAPQGLMIRGLAYRQLKKYDLAVKDLTNFLAGKASKEDMIDARYALALCQLGLKKTDQAIASLKELLKAGPSEAQAEQARYELGHAYLATNKTPEALAAFRELATKHPKSRFAAESWFHVGEIHEKANKLAEASQAYSSGLKTARVASRKEKLQYRLGWTQYQQQKYKEAAVVLQAQIKDHPRGALFNDAAYLAGDCLHRTDQSKEAIRLFEHLINGKVKKYLAKALYRSGDCHVNLKQWPQSEKQYQQFLTLFPKHDLRHEARYGLGLSCQNQKKHKEAQAAYRQVIKETTSETAAKSRFMLGEIAFSQEKYKEAIDHFLDTALGYPYKEWKALSYFEAGRCYAEIKQPKRARQMFEELIKRYPKHPRAADAQKLLKNLPSK